METRGSTNGTQSHEFAANSPENRAGNRGIVDRFLGFFAFSGIVALFEFIHKKRFDFWNSWNLVVFGHPAAHLFFFFFAFIPRYRGRFLPPFSVVSLFKLLQCESSKNERISEGSKSNSIHRRSSLRRFYSSLRRYPRGTHPIDHETPSMGLEFHGTPGSFYASNESIDR